VGRDASAVEAVAELWLPDADDRHVLAAAVALEADVLCTDNLKDFPTDTMNEATSSSSQRKLCCSFSSLSSCCPPGPRS